MPNRDHPTNTTHILTPMPPPPPNSPTLNRLPTPIPFTYQRTTVPVDRQLVSIPNSPTQTDPPTQPHPHISRRTSTDTLDDFPLQTLNDILPDSPELFPGGHRSRATHNTSKDGPVSLTGSDTRYPTPSGTELAIEEEFEAKMNRPAAPRRLSKRSRFKPPAQVRKIAKNTRLAKAILTLEAQSRLFPAQSIHSNPPSHIPAQQADTEEGMSDIEMMDMAAKDPP